MLVRSSRGGCLSSLMVWGLSALSVWMTAALVPGIEIAGFGRALVVALVLGFLNAVVRPLLVLLTLPVTVLSLGLFLVVINASVLGLSAWLLDGFSISGFLPAVTGTLVLGMVSTVLSWMFARDDDAD